MLGLAKYLKYFRMPLLAAVIALFIQAMCDLALPDLMSGIVNEGIAGGSTPYIIRVGAVMLGVSLTAAACTVISSYFAAQISAGAAKHLRRDLFEKVESFSNNEFDKFSTSSLITRTTNDVMQLQMFVFMMIRMFCYAPIIGFGGIIKTLTSDLSMSWIIGAAVIILLGFIVLMASMTLPKFKQVQRLIDRLNLVMRENLSGMLIIRAFGTEKFEEERFDKANTELTETNLFVNRAAAFMMPMMVLTMNIVTIVIIWVGAHQIAALKMQVGDMIAFMQYAMQIIMSFVMLSFMFIMLPRASVSAERIKEILDIEPAICDEHASKTFNKDFKGTILFKDVCFRYPGAEENILQHISFTAKPSETTAIIGSTGSGKTTLVNLIPRFYDVSEGQILIDGIDIRELSLYELRSKIGYVPQKGMLFSGTIASNLRFADQMTDMKDLETAARIAQAKAFINSKPEGFESEIAQGGTNVSGGQKQRLAIARALVKKAPIYIFDDSFSALDFKTDAALRKALKEELEGALVLLIAQRVHTIMDADQIIVLDEGQIAGIGTHSELMKNCGVYQEIAFSQLSKEELQL